MMKLSSYLFLIFILLPLIAQPQIKNIPEIRIAKFLRSNNNFNMVAATDHLPLFINNPLDHWTASKSELFVNGISFDEFPFNFKSPNLLPLDFPFVSNARAEILPQVKNFSAASAGYIEVSENENIQDSLVFKLNSYIGSETGDPLIHVFTKENIEQGNKNKIPLSGSLSASNQIADFSYKISLGNYGNFSTGSVNDQIIFNKSMYFSGKQNKQLFGSLGLKHKSGNNKEYSLSASAISYYGWDVPPFITSFLHFETYLYRIKVSAKNLAEGFSIFLINDGSITEVHKLKGVPGTKFRLSKYSLLSRFEFELNKILFEISSDVNHNSAVNLTDASDISSIKFFKDDYGKTTYGISIFSFIPWSNKIYSDIGIKLNSNFNREVSLSGNFKLGFSLSNENVLMLKISSVAASPNLTELFGAFIVNDFGTQDSFKISGNKNLLPERNNHLGIGYSGALNRNLKLNVEFFAERLDHPVRQKTIRAIINTSGEIYRDGFYTNTSSKETIGANISLHYNITDDFTFVSSYAYTDNSEIRYYPGHLVFTKIILGLPINSYIHLNFNYRSKTFWEEFFVPKENDRRGSTGSNGALKENYTFDFSYYQNIVSFYFLKNITLGFNVQNIFNSKIKFLPTGNYMERSIIFSFKSEI